MRRTAAVIGASLITATMLTACGGSEVSNEEEQGARETNCMFARGDLEQDLNESFDPLLEIAKESYNSGDMSFAELRELQDKKARARDRLDTQYRAWVNGESYDFSTDIFDAGTSGLTVEEAAELEEGRFRGVSPKQLDPGAVIAEILVDVECKIRANEDGCQYTVFGAGKRVLAKGGSEAGSKRRVFKEQVTIPVTKNQVEGAVVAGRSLAVQVEGDARIKQCEITAISGETADKDKVKIGPDPLLYPPASCSYRVPIA